jgi:hypothetical protein
MGRDTKGLGAKYQKDNLIALGVTKANETLAKEKAAQQKAEQAKATQKTLKGIQQQIETQARIKEAVSANRSRLQDVLTSLIVANAPANQIVAANRDFVEASNTITKVDASIKRLQDEYAKEAKGLKTESERFRTELRVQKALKDAKNNKSNPTPPKPTQPAKPPAAPKTIRFNAPMVKSAYFRNNSIVDRALLAKAVEPMLASKMVETLSTFGDGDTNRGFIVSNQKAREAALSRQSDKEKAITGGFKVPYGFRFHYNPQELNQTIGTLQGISPELMMSGKDQANMITAPTQSSTISFTLYLNRIEDMNALANFVGSESTVDTTTAAGIAAASARPINTDADSKKFYPEEVSAADRRLIKDFGTMYDLEFLFKAVNGEMGGYTSPLRGVKTADVGWLNGMAVEMHLGRKLRYLARIINISVKHILFTENMVPTLSIVSISAHRFHDTTTINTQ